MGQRGGERRPEGPHSRRTPGRAGAHARPISYARAFTRTLPALLIVVGTCYEYLTPTGYTGAPFFTAAPLVAAPLYSLRGTVFTAVATLVAVVAIHAEMGVLGDVDAVTEIATVAVVGFLAVLINILVRRGDARLASAREIAEAAQRAVLPEPDERIDGLEVAARYEAAQADAFIGGDLYAVQDTPYGVRLVVGDVRGKGIGAVAAVAVIIGAFREAAEQEKTLDAVAQRLERALVREGARRHGPDSFEGFTTAVLAEISYDGDGEGGYGGEGGGDGGGGDGGVRGGVVRIVNRGHPAPLLLHEDGALSVLAAREPALPLGMGELGSWPDLIEETDFPGGATLLFHTDGLSEARDARGNFYDPAARLAGRVFGGPEELVNTLAEEARRHTGGGATDDMALLAVRRPGTRNTGPGS